MRVSLVQMNSGPDKAENIAQARRLAERAIEADRPQMLALPELWSCFGGDRANRIAQAETLPPAGSNAAGGPAYAFLRGLARAHGIHVHGGSIGETDGGEVLFNTSVAFDPEGNELARYRKIHLFDIVTPEGRRIGESRAFGAGREVVTYRVGGLTVGCAICYDLRFAELFLALRRAGADIILLPSAFTLETGRDHWEPLLRTRAIETQCWLAAPAMWGRQAEANGAARTSYGHSMLVDPWGSIVARASDGIGWASGRIDPELGARLRRDMPVEAHRVLA